MKAQLIDLGTGEVDYQLSHIDYQKQFDSINR